MKARTMRNRVKKNNQAGVSGEIRFLPTPNFGIYHAFKYFKNILIYILVLYNSINK